LYVTASAELTIGGTAKLRAATIVNTIDAYFVFDVIRH